MNEVIENIKTRRSAKKYGPKKLENDKLDVILDAAMYSPNGMGRQGTLMVALTDTEDVRAVSKLNAKVLGVETDPFYGASTVVIVFANTDNFTFVEDGSLVMGSLMLAAHSLGVDSCWIHRAREVFSSDEGRALAKKWGVPDNYAGIGNCILGYRDGDYPTAKPRKEGFVIRV